MGHLVDAAGLRTAVAALVAGAERAVVVAVSGHGGAGKSTLADDLAAEFDGVRLGTDAFYAPNPDQAAGLFDLHDWPEILRVLRSARTAERLRYHWRWYDGTEGDVDLAMPRLLVVEGIRLIRPEVLALVDASVWLQCPPEVAGERAKQRNRAQGDSAAELALWDTRWIPEGRSYEAEHRPAEQVTWVLDTAAGPGPVS